MAGWTKAKPQGTTGDITRLNVSKELQPGQTIDIRLVGDYLPRYHYWVKTTEGKSRTVEALCFDRASESFSGGKDPIEGKRDERGQEYKAQFAYAVNVIDRRDGKIKVMELKKTIFNEIVSLASNPKYGDPADPESGYDLTISKEKTGPLPMNVKYSVLPDRTNSPLTKLELDMTLFELAKIYPESNYEKQCTWLQENTSIIAGSSDVPSSDLPDDDDLPM